METGLNRRFSRLVNSKSGKSLFVALDHGLTGGPPPGFEQYASVKGWADHADVDALVMHKGTLKAFTRQGLAMKKPVILQSNGMSMHAANPSDKPILIEVEDVVRLGANAISVEFAAEKSSFSDNLRAISSQIDAADRFGLPVMVMLGINDAPNQSEAWVSLHRAISRTLIELGATIIKLRQPPHVGDWQPMIEGLCADAHFVMAGGVADKPDAVLARTRAGLDAGAGGVCIGRNVFQHARPAQFLTEMGAILNSPSEDLAFTDELLEASL